MQGNSPSYELPVFVSPQAGDKGMHLFEKNTAALPWKRLFVVLYSPSTQHNETVQLPPFTALGLSSYQHIHNNFSLSIYFPPFSSAGPHSDKSLYPHTVNTWMIDVLFLWCVGTGWVCQKSLGLLYGLVRDCVLCPCASTGFMHPVIRWSLQPSSIHTEIKVKASKFNQIMT